MNWGVSRVRCRAFFTEFTEKARRSTEKTEDSFFVLVFSVCFSPFSPCLRGEGKHRTLETPAGISTAVTLNCVATYTRAQIAERRAAWKREGKVVVFTNGCYDLLHPGHVRLLESARSLGDVLVLGLNTDASVLRSKGPSRPIVAEEDRAAVAEALAAVDAVVFFDEDTPRELIAELLPDVLVKGADWSHFVAGREEVEAAGGRVAMIPLEPGYSSTNLVERALAQS